MRITYQDGKLFVSLNDEEVDTFYKNKHKTVEIPIGFLKVLHEDISKCVMAHWSKVEVWDALESHQKTVRKSKD